VKRWICKRLWPVLKTSVIRWSDDGGSLHSAALAYCAALSLFPLCLTLVAALGVVSRLSGKLQNEQEQILELVRHNFGPWLADQFQLILDAVKGRAAVGGTLGLLTLICAALAIFVQLESMFNCVWRDSVPRRHGWLAAIWGVVYERIVAFLMLLGISLSVMALFIANMVLSGLKIYGQQLPFGHISWMLIQWLFAILANGLLLGLIFKIIPRAPVRWRDAFRGGLLSALVLQIGQYFLARYIISDYYSLYGIVGSFIAVMVWFYYASAVVFFGAEVARTFGEKTPGY
jgi:membrane protein